MTHWKLTGVNVM